MYGDGSSATAADDFPKDSVAAASQCHCGTGLGRRVVASIADHCVDYQNLFCCQHDHQCSCYGNLAIIPTLPTFTTVATITHIVTNIPMRWKWRVLVANKEAPRGACVLSLQSTLWSSWLLLTSSLLQLWWHSFSRSSSCNRSSYV